MTVELDIVERKNEENLKLSKQMSDTMKKLNLDENEPIAPITTDADDLDTTQTAAPSTEVQRFYAGKNVFITGGTGKQLWSTPQNDRLSSFCTAMKIAFDMNIHTCVGRMLNSITNELIGGVLASAWVCVYGCVHVSYVCRQLVAFKVTYFSFISITIHNTFSYIHL